MRVGHVLTEHTLKFQDQILYPIAAACKGATVVRFLIKRILQALFVPVAITLLVAFVIRLFLVQCRRFSRKDFSPYVRDEAVPMARRFRRFGCPTFINPH